MKVAKPITSRSEIVDRDAIEIGEAYQEARRSAIDMAARLVGIGQRLIAKKAEVKAAGKNWDDWLHLNSEVLGFRPRSAYSIISTTISVSKRLNIDENFLRLTAEIDDDTARQIVQQAWGNVGVTHGTQGSGQDEWYTPSEYVEAARKVLGSIELDPASSQEANECIKAERYFTIDDNALTKDWKAATVFMNPPYSTGKVFEFVKKLRDELKAGNVGRAIMLVNSYTDTAWFHIAEEIAVSICFTRGRIEFVDTRGERNSPICGQAFFYFDSDGDADAFGAVFRDYGFVR